MHVSAYFMLNVAVKLKNIAVYSNKHPLCMSGELCGTYFSNEPFLFLIVEKMKGVDISQPT